MWGWLFILSSLMSACDFYKIKDLDPGSSDKTWLILKGIFFLSLALFSFCKKYGISMTGEKQNVTKNLQQNKQINHVAVECPYCHSKDTKKITTTEKATNTIAFGLLGQKRKCNFHCNSCKSNF